jgi:transcriptional regulator with XRE-family HTH domain
MGKPTRSPATAEFGRRVRARRHELGLSQEALAERSGLSWSYVSSVERGERNIALHNVLHIAHGLETDACELVRGLKLPGGRKYRGR